MPLEQHRIRRRIGLIERKQCSTADMGSMRIEELGTHSRRQPHAWDKRLRYAAMRSDAVTLHPGLAARDAESILLWVGGGAI